MKRSEDLNERLKNVILSTCNTIGCKDCGLKWNDGKDCSATDLQSRYYDAIEEESKPEPSDV